MGALSLFHPPKIFIYKFVKIGGEGFLWLFADCGGEQIKTKDFDCLDGDGGVLFLKRLPDGTNLGLEREVEVVYELEGGVEGFGVEV